MYQQYRLKRTDSDRENEKNFIEVILNQLICFFKNTLETDKYNFFMETKLNKLYEINLYLFMKKFLLFNLLIY